MNKVILIGNLTRDPELTETPNGVAVCHFGLAVSREYADANGNRETDFFNITVWRGRAENCAKFIKKGNKVGIVGSLQNRSYDDNEGVKRTITDVIASEVEFLTPKSQENSDKTEEKEEVVSTKRTRPQLEPIDDNQLPF